MGMRRSTRRRRCRSTVLLRWLAKAEPDVVCLQELKAADEPTLSLAGSKIGAKLGDMRYNRLPLGASAGTHRRAPT